MPRPPATRAAARRVAVTPAGAGPPPAGVLALLRVLVTLVPIVLGACYVRDTLVTHGRLAFPLDDPYIHLQYARNLAGGHGFAFNPGEPSPGATSPLWVLLLAGAHGLGLPFEWAAVVLGLLAAGAAALLTFETARACGRSLALATLAGLALGSMGRFTWASASGMEPCLAAALVMLLLRLALTRAGGLARGVGLGLVAGLAVEARPELVLLALLVGVSEVFRALARAGGAPAESGAAIGARLVPVIGYVAAIVVVVAPYLLFCHATTGRWLPNTYYAKSVIPRLIRPDLMRERRADYFRTMAVWLWRDDPATALLLVPGTLLALRRQPSGAWLVACFPPVFWAWAWLVSPLHFNLSRYTIPLLPCVAVLATAALGAGARWLPGAGARRVAFALAAVVVVGGAVRHQPDFFGVYHANVDNIASMQVKMGEWVQRTLPPGAPVATNDIGAIAWYGGHPVIDTEGLVSSGLLGTMLARLRAASDADLDDVLLEELPRLGARYVIVFPSWHPGLVAAPWLERIYEIDYPNNTGGGNELVVYRVRAG